MQIDLVPTAEAVTPDRVRGASVLVVDVLRASTTIIAALASGAVSVVPVADPDEARRRAGTRVLVAGERRGQKVGGFDLGNSPVEFAVRPVDGRTIILTTSNGTRRRAAGHRLAVGAAARRCRTRRGRTHVSRDRHDVAGAGVPAGR